ncbi:CTB family bacteriocin [Dolichospermum circinale]|uniref:CTB family bacteriocin n=1 Tax=Dolichospermum circinale TaxID=109265 RepID=UPI00047FCB46|nr:CTB family bacteriocin [Dolichospermum circinale]MDB9473371.1 CTB family bacteriocin [Dolichospermum circinale CS-537/11]MDB9480701.1 CTB family bacteriocin [Dolichospermum circinale CS-537/03]
MNYLINPRYSINKRGGKQQPSSKQPPAIIQIKENLVMSTLFTAVSVEQQEIVAGGYHDHNHQHDYGHDNGQLALFVTGFSGENTVQVGGTQSGWNGSQAGGYQYTTNVKTFGVSFLKA